MRIYEQPVVKHVFRCGNEDVTIRLPYISVKEATERIAKTGRQYALPPTISITGSLAVAFEGESPEKLLASWRKLLDKGGSAVANKPKI